MLEQYSQLRTESFRQYLIELAEDEKYYKLKFGQDLIPKEWREKGFDVTLPPTAYNAIEAASDHILTTPDILVSERPTETDYLREQQIAAAKQMALMFFWHQIFLQGDPLGNGKKSLIKSGKMVLKLTLDFNVIRPDGAFVGRQGFPFRGRLLSASTVFEDPNFPYDPQYVYEAYEMRRDTAQELFPDARGKWKEKPPGEMCRVLEYWSKPHDQDRGRRVIWIDDVRVLNKINPYSAEIGRTDKGKPIYDGFVPYFVTETGWGDGEFGVPAHERYVGLIRHVHSLLETEARQLTAADAQLRIGTFPIVKLEGIEEDDEHPIRIGPGAKIHVQDPETQDISILTWPQIDPALFGMISRVHQYTNELSKFEQLSGTPQRGVDTATEADQNFRAASSKLNGPINGLRSLIMRVNAYVLWCIENVIEAPVTLYGAADGTPGVITLEPEWIAGYYDTFVDLKTTSAAALEGARLRQWAEAYQVFGLDKAFAMKMAGIPNPNQRIANRMNEDVLLDPRVHEIRLANWMRQNGGELGKMLSMPILERLMHGDVPDETGAAPSGGGGFPAPATSQPTNRTNPNAEPQSELEQAARAAGVERATETRPDLQLQ